MSKGVRTREGSRDTDTLHSTSSRQSAWASESCVSSGVRVRETAMTVAKQRIAREKETLEALSMKLDINI